MIYVDVTGTRNNKLKKELVRAAYFYLKQLKVNTNLDVVIRLSNLEVDGYCDYNYDDYDKEVVIELNNKLSTDELLVSLAHELVHAKQYVKKELKTNNGVNYWKGAIFTQTKFVDNMVPWEVEAYQQEQQLFEDYESKTRTYR